MPQLYARYSRDLDGFDSLWDFSSDVNMENWKLRIDMQRLKDEHSELSNNYKKLVSDYDKLTKDQGDATKTPQNTT